MEMFNRLHDEPRQTIGFFCKLPNVAARSFGRIKWPKVKQFNEHMGKPHKNNMFGHKSEFFGWNTLDYKNKLPGTTSVFYFGLSCYIYIISSTELLIGLRFTCGAFCLGSFSLELLLAGLKQQQQQQRQRFQWPTCDRYCCWHLWIRRRLCFLYSYWPKTCFAKGVGSQLVSLMHPTSWCERAW